MATDVLMPQMGESITEGTVVKWLKKVGDTVQRDEPLLEISTDKVDAEIPSPAAGVLLEILAKEGETVAVNGVLARLGESSEAGATAQPKAQAQAEKAQTQAEAPVQASKPVTPATGEVGPAREEPAIDTRPGGVEAPPAGKETAPPPLPAQRPAPQAPPQPPPQPPSPQTSTAGSSAASATAAAVEPDGKKVRSSPLVRNIAREHSVNLEEIQGSGIGGRVTKEDILSYIEQRKVGSPTTAPAPAVTPSAPAPAPAPAPQVPAYGAGERVSIEPMNIMRRKIAEHMVLSRRTSAHVTTFFEIDFTNIARLRDQLKKSFEERNGTKLTFMPFIIKAVIDALKAYPVINASLDGENIVYKHDINIGIAVALDGGLIVPVIKQADALSLVGLARATQDLATRARNKQLKPDEVSGGTFSISNFGLYGGYTATPIINQPQAAILGVGGIHKRPWVLETPEGDAIAIRHIGVLSLSFDHRLIDGAVADQFMEELKKTLETTDFSSLV